jgi:AcrR family transcriptional regulator
MREPVKSPPIKSPPGKSVRRYESPRRREQAEATRRHILQTAQRLFEGQGYLSTTMAAIADEAGVSAKTVYLAFDTKGGLLRALWHFVLLGDDDDENAVARSNWYREVLDEPDAARQLRLNARNSATVKARAAAFMKVIRDAAGADDDLGALWHDIQTEFHANQGVIVQLLHDRRALRADLDVERATDILWTLNHPDVWQLLVVERHWSPEQYEQWLSESTCAQLLPATTQ